MNSQEMILGAIATAIGTHEDVVLLDDRTYGNTGTLRTVRKGTLDHIAKASYNFQNSYVHFGPMSNYIAAHWYGQSAEGKAAWVKGSISELVDAVAAHLLKENA